MVGWWRPVYCKISLRTWFIPLDLVLAGLELQCLAEWKAQLQCAMPWMVCLFSCTKTLWSKNELAESLYPPQCTYLDWTSALFQLHQFVRLVCTKKYQPLMTCLLVIYKQKGNSSNTIPCTLICSPLTLTIWTLSFPLTVLLCPMLVQLLPSNPHESSAVYLK